jgi:hypothetical protein
MPKKFNPFSGTFDYYSNSDFTGDLNDSASTKIATIIKGEVSSVDFGAIRYLLQEDTNFILQEDNASKLIL